MDISLPTLALSALVSIFTGAIGVLLSITWQRRQDRRTIGLALLAEIKAIRRGLVQYRDRLSLMLADERLSPEEREHLRTILPYWRHDSSIFAVSSNRIGLFTPALATELVEMYMHVRWLDARAGAAPATMADGSNPLLTTWLAQHSRAVQHAERRARLVVGMLKAETPRTFLQFAQGRGRGQRHRRAALLRDLRRLARIRH